MCSLSMLGRGILSVSGPCGLLGTDRHTPWANVRPNGAQRSITQKHRLAIYGAPRAGRHDVEGGQAHVLAVPGSAHSQAPPIAHTDGAARQASDGAEDRLKAAAEAEISAKKTAASLPG